MSARTVSVVLTAQVGNYLTNFHAASEATRQLDTRTRTVTETLRAQQETFRKHNEALKTVGVGMLAVGATAAAGVALVVKATADFGAKMAQLQSLSHASAGTMKQAADAAMTVGAAYGYSATQVADAQIELQKAGIGITAQLGGALKGALSLAAAGQLDVAQATEITTVAMTQFHLSAKDVPHLADLLAAGADKALGSVGDLGEALKNGGLQAHNMGLTIDDTVGLLSAFANAGILGAEAGTQMRSMFLRLQNPTSASKKVLDEYGISINDASGKFVGITKFAGELHDRLTTLKGTNEKLTDAQRNQALATIFGSHAIVGASVLYADGAKQISGWIKAVNDSGFANQQASGKLNSLTGDVQKLSAAFQTDLIKAGTGANDTLRGITQGATGLLGFVGSIPAPLLNVGIGLTAVTAGVGLLGGTALIAVPKLALFEQTLNAAGIQATPFSSAMSRGGKALTGLRGAASATASFLTGPFGLGLAAAGAAVEIYDQAVQKAQVSTGVLDAAASRGASGVDALVTSAAKGSNVSTAVSSAISDWSTFGTVEKSVTDHLKDNLQEIAHNNSFGMLGASLNLFIPQAKGTQEAMGRVGEALGRLADSDAPKAASAFEGIIRQYKLGGKEQGVLLSLMPAYQSALQQQATKMGLLTGKESDATRQKILLSTASKNAAAAGVMQQLAASRQASALASLAGQASSATTNIDQLQKTIEGFGSAQLDARSASRALEQAFADAMKEAEKGHHTLNKQKTDFDISTESGRAAAQALDQIATGADNAASKILKQSGSTAKAAAEMQRGRDHFIKAAEAMGLSASAAKKLADRLGLIPGNINTAVNVSGLDAALNGIATAQAALKSLNGRTASVAIHYTQTGQNLATGGAKFADGGAIQGPGPKGVDSVPALLAPGEHVLTAREVDRLGGQGGVYAFRAAVDRGDVQHYAAGGAVHHRSVKHRSNTAHRGPDTGTDRNKSKTQQHAADLGAIHGKDAAAATARAAAAAAQRKIAADTKRIKAQEKAAKAAAAALTKAQDAAAKISGKGTAAAKHAATLHARDLAKKSKAAAARVTATQKQIDAATKVRDAAKQKQQEAEAAAKQLRQGREDFTSQQRRATPANPIDPMSYVDQLRQMSRDDNYSPARQASMDATANRYEASLVSLTTRSQEAAAKLDTLKQASVQLHDSISQAVSGSFSLSGAASRQTASGWINRDGMRFQTTTTGPTASSIAGYYQAGKGTAQQFASVLRQLAGRGLNSSLLAELAGMGTDAGMPIAQAILSGSDADIASTNDGYAGIAAAAGDAGTAVADANYAAQIAAADKNAQEITDAIGVQTKALQHVIAQAFGLKGYAGGTRNATPGLHWVGEHGPELLGFRGGETVLTAPDSRRWIRGASGGHAAPQVSVTAPQVRMPDTITVQDLHGFKATMRVVAVQEIAKDAQHDAVLMMGGAA